MKALFFISEEPMSSWTWRRAIHVPQFGQNHFVELAPGRLGSRGHSSAYPSSLCPSCSDSS